MKIGLISALVVAAALALGACGGTDDTANATDSSAPAPTNTASADEPAEGACKLLDEKKLATIVGGPVNHSNREASSSEGEGCIWNREDLKSGAGVVSLTYLNDDDEDFFRQNLKPDTESYRSVGDGASMESGGILVLVGDRAIKISGTGPFEDPATLEALATTAAARR